MDTGNLEATPPETVIHRVGGGSVENLRLSPLDANLSPPGISVLMGGTPQEAAGQMRQAFAKSRKWQEKSKTVGTTTAAKVIQAGFQILADRTSRFPNHARIIHPNGVAGFTDENLEVLSQAMTESTGC